MHPKVIKSFSWFPCFTHEMTVCTNTTTDITHHWAKIGKWAD